MLIDVSMTITSGSVFRRGTPPVSITSQKFHHESEGEYESVMVYCSAHTATHVDLVYPEKRIEPERFISPGKLIDVSNISGSRVALADVTNQVTVDPGDFVFFRTGWSEFAGTAKYHVHPELTREVINWLVDSRVSAAGIDAPGLGLGRRHGEYDQLLANHDILIVENLVNLEAIPKQLFKVYCFPLKIENSDAIPARVIVEVESLEVPT